MNLTGFLHDPYWDHVIHLVANCTIAIVFFYKLALVLMVQRRSFKNSWKNTFLKETIYFELFLFCVGTGRVFHGIDSIRPLTGTTEWDAFTVLVGILHGTSLLPFSRKFQEVQKKLAITDWIQRELRRDHEMIRALLLYAPTGVVALDAGLTIVMHSRQWARDYKLPERGMLGKCFYDVIPDMPEHWLRDIEKVLLGETVIRHELEYMRNARGDRFCHIMVPWTSPNGSGVLCFNRYDADVIGVDQVHRATLELRRTIERAEKSACLLRGT